VNVLGAQRGNVALGGFTDGNFGSTVALPTRGRANAADGDVVILFGTVKRCHFGSGLDLALGCGGSLTLEDW